jgi:hypothetical protein
MGSNPDISQKCKMCDISKGVVPTHFGPLKKYLKKELNLPVSHHLSLFVELGPAHHADIQLGALSFSPLSSLQAHEKILEKKLV